MNSVPQEGRILYCTPAFAALFKQAADIQRTIDARSGGTLDRRVTAIEDVIIKKVPSARLKTQYDFSDGCVPADGALQINAILIHPSCQVSRDKYAYMKLFTPGSDSRTADNYIYQNRYYTGTFLIDAKACGIAINVQEPQFESQTKIKLGSLTMEPNGGISVNKFVGDFVKTEVDNYLHKNLDVAEIIEEKIKDNERDRKAIAGVTKLARERAKKANLHNRKLRDCKIHLNDPKGELKEESSIFITEGDSASGSITKSRDVMTQAVFSLRGKPLNSYGLTKKVVYENEEFNLLQAALNIEDGIDGLRYNKVIVATDADVDGMHIRLLMITFFLQFFPELVRTGHVYILQTPLFRVRNRKKRIKKAVLEQYMEEHPDNKGDFITIYCYSDEERQKAIEMLGPEPEITRFKGLGEISPDEFKNFIGADMRLESVTLRKTDQVKELLEYYMGKNTMQRQNFIINNLVIEEDKPEEDTELEEEE